MAFILASPEILVWIAGALYAFGYLVINQVILRILVLIGTGFYTWYYFVVSGEPLWEAIIISLVIGAANIIGLSSLTLRNSRFAVPSKHRDIYKQRFKNMPPGDFRQLMKFARREVTQSERTITTEGATVNELYFVVSGNLTIEKRCETFTMPAGLFVGEIAYLTEQKGSATTKVPAGAEVLIWDFAVLKKHGARKPRFKLALEAMISKDLAVKVAFAVAPHQENWSPDEVVVRLAQA